MDESKWNTLHEGQAPGPPGSRLTGLWRPRIAIGALLAASLLVAYAGADPPINQPPEDDPSHFTGPLVEDLPEGLPEANEGTYEGGVTGTAEDAGANNVLQGEDQRKDGFWNVPTNGPPSPLFSATPFSQQMLRFEEFGPQQFTASWNQHSNGQGPKGDLDFPTPLDFQSGPDGAALEDFLSQDGLFPHPTVFSNEVDQNPWKNQIESFIGRTLEQAPAEGRPPGLGWSHQRAQEFRPKVWFQTAQAGARVNGGFRDDLQSHGYNTGEFGPGGLYHNTVGLPGFEGSTGGIPIKFHPNMPVQDPKALWTFDGTLPPKLLSVRYGETVLMRHYNALPIDVAANRGFGVHTITTHEHNGHSPAESDGYANAFFFPGQYYDYRWPLPLAGHDSINTTASDIRAGRPNGHGGITKIPGDWRETMSTHWFHDHMLDFTAQNVYKGNAAMMNYYSALDRGNEGLNDGVNLRLPSGTALDWGNRDYDVNLLIADKAWDREGQLWFNPFNTNGFIGDNLLTNWLYKPYFEVRARRYRFRILNGSVSRYFKLALINEAGDRVPFYMVANDGNIMEHTVYFADGQLPTQGIAERYDIIVDFSQFEEGDKLYFVNVLSHRDGQITNVPIPLEDILDGTYNPTQVDDDGDGWPDRWVDGDPAVGKFLEFRVKSYNGVDQSMNPADFVAGKQKLIPLRRPTEDELANARHRTFLFEKNPTDEKPWTIETDGNSKGFGMDPRRLTAAPSKNYDGLEVWRIINGGDWSHPIHIHFEEGIILRRDGKEPPEWEKWARKDMYRIGPQEDSGAIVEVALRFREFAGTYMEHCHNTQHEDHAMLMRWDIEHPGQVKLMPTPLPTWEGVEYVDTRALPTFRSGDGTGEFGPKLDPVEEWVDGIIVEDMDLANMEIGDALNPTEDERGRITYPLRRAINNDNGVETEVFFVLHDVNDEELADEFGIIYAGGLKGTPLAATSPASYDPETDEWTFFGNLPNPINSHQFPQPQDPNNTYTPLRYVNIGGKNVIVNAFFVQWGDGPFEHMRIDQSCVSFPDDPPNTSCPYNGAAFGDAQYSGHALAINTTGPNPTVTLKLHKSWFGGDFGGPEYLPYYIVVDTYPAGPARDMGIPYVPKHAFLAGAAVPLVQFIPPTPLGPGYPPTPSDGFGLSGGGPLGGQIGMPSYFMPGEDFSPMWHIGFTHWLQPATEVVKSLERIKELRAEGKLEILEFPPPPNIGTDSYDFENLNSPHVVNCPTPITLDMAVHRAMKRDRAENNP
jgi:FtsP/CotA-like multicopper oxidase with cupredoxin domain